MHSGGLGDSQTALYCLIVSVLSNIGLDVLFVAVFRWGVAGSAWATALAQALSAVVAAVLLFRKYPMMRMRRQDLRLHGKLLRQITVLAIPIAVQSAFNNLGNLVAQSAVNLFGEATMAAYTAASRIGTLALMPVETIGSSLSVYASQNHGAGKPQRIRQGYGPPCSCLWWSAPCWECFCCSAAARWRGCSSQSRLRRS